MPDGVHRGIPVMDTAPALPGGVVRAGLCDGESAMWRSEWLNRAVARMTVEITSASCRKEIVPDAVKAFERFVERQHRQPFVVTPEQPQIAELRQRVAAFEIEVDAERLLEPAFDAPVELLSRFFPARAEQE